MNRSCPATVPSPMPSIRRVWREPSTANETADEPSQSAEEEPAGICEESGNSATGRYCGICTDLKRERAMIMVVSSPAAIAKAEEDGFQHVYHVHSPSTNSQPQTPYPSSVSRLLERLRRYRPVGVILNLDDLTEQSRLQEALTSSGLGVDISTHNQADIEEMLRRRREQPGAWMSQFGEDFESEQRAGPDNDPEEGQ